MMASSSEFNNIVKAGWLFRQSSILKRWKRNWFVLDKEGNLRYFESQQSPKAEERIVVRVYVKAVKAGNECQVHDPPEDVNRALCGFLEVVLQNDIMVLCAADKDEMKAWQISLEQARAMPPMPAGAPGVGYMPAAPVHYVSPYGPYYGGPYIGGPSLGLGIGYSSGYQGQVISTTPTPAMAPATQQVIRTPTGTTTIVQAPVQQMVVVDDDPWRYGRRHCHGYHRRHCGGGFGFGSGSYFY